MNTTTAVPPTAPAVDPRSFQSFAQFYPFYLTEHSNVTCRRLHFLGSSLSLACFVMVFITGNLSFILLGLLCGYGCAWVGHFGFEKKQTRLFQTPAVQLYGRLGDVQRYLAGQGKAIIFIAIYSI